MFSIGARLMASPIASIPGASKMKDHWILPHKHSTLAWIAMVEKLGLFTPPPTPICYKDQVLPIKEWGNIAISKSVTGLNENRFGNNEILIQGKEGAHDICQWAVDNKLGNESSSIPWENTIMKLWNSINRSDIEQQLLSVFIRLGKTQPSQMPGWNAEHTDSLLMM